jgi:hypothetical protein
MKAILIKLNKDGVLKELFKKGIVSPKIGYYYEIYLEYDRLKTVRKMRTTDAVTHVAEKFKVSEATVYLAIRTINK